MKVISVIVQYGVLLLAMATVDAMWTHQGDYYYFPVDCPAVVAAGLPTCAGLHANAWAGVLHQVNNIPYAGCPHAHYANDGVTLVHGVRFAETDRRGRKVWKKRNEPQGVVLKDIACKPEAAAAANPQAAAAPTAAAPTAAPGGANQRVGNPPHAGAVAVKPIAAGKYEIPSTNGCDIKAVTSILGNLFDIVANGDKFVASLNATKALHAFPKPAPAPAAAK